MNDINADLLIQLKNLVGLAAHRPGKLHEYKAAIEDARVVIARAEGRAVAAHTALRTFPLPEAAHGGTLARPEGLSDLGNAAYDVILPLLQKHDMTSTGGCKAFFRPDEWPGDYGHNSELVICYEGSALSTFFALDYAYPSYKLYEEMRLALEEIGLYSEEGTSHQCSLYRIK